MITNAHKVLQEYRAEIEAHGAILVTTDCRAASRWLISNRGGDGSYYEVPAGQRGILAQWAGQTVRMWWHSRSRNGRNRVYVLPVNNESNGSETL